MPARHRRLGRHLAVALAFLGMACSDSTGPQAHLSDPQGLSTDLLTVAGVLQSPAFQSFSALSVVAGSPVAAPSRAGTLLGAAPIVPPRTSAQLYANPTQFLALRRSATAFAGGISTSVVPSQLLGKTFVWDVATHAYVEDPAASPAAPPDRVRIILYAVDPITGQIVESPLTAVGYADLVDESTTPPAVDKLHVIVTGGTPASPGATYVDYTVSAQVTGTPATAFTATANGSLSDGTHTLTFSATFAVTHLDTNNPDIQIDVTWDLDNPAIHVALHETLATPNANELDLTLTEFSITRGMETVSVHGTITVVLSPQTVTVNLAIDVNGVPWARISGTNNAINVRHADGSALSAAELQALSDLFGLPDAIETAILSLFGPPETLMGA